MEGALISTVVSFVVSYLKDSKGAKQASDEFSSALWNWVKPIFIEDEKLKENLTANPDDTKSQKELADKIEYYTNSNPNTKKELEGILYKFNVISSVGNTSVGGDFLDMKEISNSNINITQNKGLNFKIIAIVLIAIILIVYFMVKNTGITGINGNDNDYNEIKIQNER